MNLLKMLKMAAVTLLISGLISSNAMAASTTGTADALVIKPLAIEVDPTPLSFGGIVSGPAGTVTVDVTFGTLSSTGGIQTVVPSAHSQSFFSVTGEGNRAFNTTVDSSVTLSNGTDSMTADLTSSNTSPLNAGGFGLIAMGGTLSVGANQASGSYTGTYNVSVDY